MRLARSESEAIRPWHYVLPGRSSYCGKPTGKLDVYLISISSLSQLAKLGIDMLKIHVLLCYVHLLCCCSCVLNGTMWRHRRR